MPSVRSCSDHLQRVTLSVLLLVLSSCTFLDTWPNEGQVDGNIIVVTTASDHIIFGDGQLSLREALLVANYRSGIEEIRFAEILSGSTITLQSALPFIRDDVVIQGLPGQTPTISGNHHERAFVIIFEETLATIENLTLTDGSVERGGGIFNYGSLTVKNSTITGNSASKSGGGIFSENWLSVVNSTITGNLSDEGGGIYTSYYARIVDSTIEDNVGGRAGGGIFNNAVTGVTMSITRSLITHNASPRGAGIYNSHDLSIAHSILSGNASTHDGGGIFNIGSLATITHSTISGNSAADDGGGIFNVLGGQINLINSTISGNLAFDGGAVSSDSGSVDVFNSTISDNTASNKGGGVYLDVGMLDLFNSLIVRSGNGGNCVGNQPIVAGSDTLIDTGRCDGATVDPDAGHPDVFGIELEANGTTIQAGDPNTGTIPLRTHRLQPGHPGINAGTNSLIPPEIIIDQRGFPRIVEGNVDIGSVEHQATP